MNCPLCKSQGPFHKQTDALKRILYACSNCYLVFAGMEFLPDQAGEKNRYMEHNNSLDKQEYLGWLRSLVKPYLKHLRPNMSILDYGCGPVKALAEVLKEYNFESQSYDPLFYSGLPGEKFDCIFLIETAEHFFTPQEEFQRLTSMLKDNGLLLIATYTWEENTNFRLWHYARDITHVTFYHQNTMKWIESRFGLRLIEIGEKRTFLFRK